MFDYLSLLDIIVIEFLFPLHLSLQYFTSSHTFSHFFRQEKGRRQVMQILEGRFAFFIAFIKFV
jgi:hypothetical protein